MIEPTLAAAAFGNAPETWPLPTAVTPHQLWLRAVASGGQGRYGSAYRDLAEIRRAAAGPVTSLAHSTQGSFLRQLGWHALARRWDGRALALAGADPAARADALIGLATLLARVDAGRVGDRVAVRRQWVAAELAMATGDGAVAVGHAERAVELARATAGVRHQVKSDVVLAAALCSAGHIDRASAVGAAALETAGQRGLIPLKWALACLLIDTGSVTVPVQPMRELTQIRDICAGQMQRAGGIWRTA